MICFLGFWPSISVARVGFSISIGTPFVHCWPGFYPGCYPYYGWYGGYYTWLDRDRYVWFDVGRYRHGYMPRSYYWRRPLVWPGIGVWIGDSCPEVITHRQVVVETKNPDGKSKHDAEAAKLSEKQRKKNSELLKILRIGDRERRVQAICDLAGFSCDDRVRKALEDVLLSDPDAELRKQVATAFGKTKNPSVVAALEKAKAEDSSREVRQAAYRSIIMIEGY